jgi:hypothetical protein
MSNLSCLLELRKVTYQAVAGPGSALSILLRVFQAYLLTSLR